MGVRPEVISLVAGGKGILKGEVEVMEHLGADSFAYVRVDDVGLFTIRIVGHSPLVPNDKIGLSFAISDIYLFDAAGKTLSIS